VGSFSIAFKAFGHGEAAKPARTDRDISMVSIILGVVLSTVAVGIFFASLQPTWAALFAGVVLLLLFSFFFTSVAANAIATTANNPASGMTMLTVIVSSLVLLNFGISGTTGMFFVMAIAGMVCTALCVSGQFITDLKAGYWLGSTPAAQEKVKFLGVAVSAIASGLTIILLAHTFQFGEALPGDARQVLAAPQASIMKALVVGFMSHQPVAYLLFGIGAAISVVMEMLGKSSLVFALGMYLPLQLTTPILAGGFLSHLVNKKSEKKGGEEGKSIRERGVILASGLMAGGALGGVLGASLRMFSFYREDLIQTPFYANDTAAQLVSVALFLGLCLYVWFVAQKKDSPPTSD
jgi:putative OPT family oligopeptide transporter